MSLVLTASEVMQVMDMDLALAAVTEGLAPRRAAWLGLALGQLLELGAGDVAEELALLRVGAREPGEHALGEHLHLVEDRRQRGSERLRLTGEPEARSAQRRELPEVLPMAERSFQRRPEHLRVRGEHRIGLERAPQPAHLRVDERLAARDLAGEVVVRPAVGDAPAEDRAGRVDDHGLRGRRSEVDPDEALECLDAHGDTSLAAPTPPRRRCSIIWK